MGGRVPKDQRNVFVEALNNMWDGNDGNDLTLKMKSSHQELIDNGWARV